MGNEPKKYVGMPQVDKLRDAIENEAKWIFYLTREGLENGLPVDFAVEAMNELGAHYAANDYAGCDTPEKLCEKLMDRAMREAREAEAEVSGDALRVEAGYCPMLHMWDLLTDAPALKRTMCDVACGMFNGIAEGLGFEFAREAAIAHGDGCCRLCFKRKA